MVGAGVFTTSGFTLKSLGSQHAVVLAWIVGGGVALCGAYSYGRLIRAMPESGGEYTFLSRAAHPLLGFIAGWVSLIAGFTGAIAFAATAFESYVMPQQARPDWLPSDLIAVSAVLLAALVHGLRPGLGARLQNLAVLLKVGLLAGFLVVALAQPAGQGWHGLAAEPLSGDTGSDVTFRFASALVWISLSYSGFNAAVYIAGEATSARSDVPRALMMGSFLVFVLYVLLNAVLVYAPPARAIAGKPDVAAIAAEWIGGGTLAGIVRAIIALALLTSVSSMMMAAPRVYAKMAEDELLPGFLRLRDGSPREAVAAQCVLATLFIVVSTLQGLLSYLGVTLSLCAAMSVACLFLTTMRKGPLIKVSNLAPFVFVAATCSSATIMAIGDPSQVAGAALTFALGALAYLAVGRERARPAR